MKKNGSKACECRSTGLATKVTGAVNWLCAHTSITGGSPYIKNFWSPLNPVSPDNILAGSGLKYDLVCPDCKSVNTRKPSTYFNTRKPSTYFKTGTFKCDTCKKSHLLRDKVTTCDCRARGIPKTIKSKGYI